MKYYILDKNLDTIEILELYSSSIWTRRFWDVGDFELYLPADEKTVPLFAEAINNGYYIVGENDLTHAMMPLKLELDIKKDSGNYISVKGYDLKYLLNRRIVWDYSILGGELEVSVRNLVDKNAIHPDNPERIIPLLYLDDGEPAGIHDIINTSLFGKNLAVGIKDLCKLYGCGWDIVLDLPNKKMIFKVLKGENLSSTVIFSNEMENLQSTKYSLDFTQPKNIAYVDARLISQNPQTLKEETIDLSQAVTLNGYIPKGLDRYELYVDNNVNYDGRYSLATYNYILRANAKQSLKNAKIKDEISGEIIPNYTYQFGRDYNIGDIVAVKNEYNQSFVARVTEIIQSISNDKDTTIPSFNIVNEDSIPTPVDPNTIRITNREGELPGSEDYRITSSGELRALCFTYTTERICMVNGSIVQRSSTINEESIDRSAVTLFDSETNL